MARCIVRIACEDHVSPVLRAINDALLVTPADTPLPPLPAVPVVVETAQRGAGASITMRPSPEILEWLADVQRMATPVRRRLVIADEVDPMTPAEKAARGLA